MATNTTPINVSDIKESFNSVKVKTLTKSAFRFNVDKYNAFFILSILVFVAGLGFWSYVHFLMSGS